MATYKLPEQYLLDETVNVPNNELPALVYRNVLPEPPTSESAQQICKGNGWEKRVSNRYFNVELIVVTSQGEWGEIKTPHFHPNTHECYGIRLFYFSCLNLIHCSNLSGFIEARSRPCSRGQ